MSGKRSFLEGWLAFWASFRYMRQRGMKGWILVFSLTTVLGWCGIAFAWWYSLTHLRDIILESPSLGTMNSSAIDADAFTWSGIRELSRIVFSQGLASLIQILFAVAGVFLNLKITKFLVLAILGPLIAMLSERASSGGKESQPSSWNWGGFLHGFVRGAKSALLMFLVEIGLGIIIGLGSFLVSMLLPFLAPFLLVLVPLAFGVLGSWFYGAAMFDCIWERRGLGSRAGLKASRELGSAVVGLGFPLYIFMTIPFLAFPLGLILGPVGGAVGAVLLDESEPNG